MSFDKHYPNRKDKRRLYSGSKAFDRSCRNHGSCPWCWGEPEALSREEEVDGERKLKRVVQLMDGGDRGMKWGLVNSTQTEHLGEFCTLSVAFTEGDGGQFQVKIRIADTPEGYEKGKSIVRLIAAAPELLEVCKRAKKLLESEVTKEPDRTIFWELVAAISRAYGI